MPKFHHQCPNCQTEVEPGGLLGMEVPGVYDGVLTWTHMACGTSWPRFSSGRLHDAAVRYLSEAVE